MFHIPGRKTQVRLFDRVATVDDQYDIFDVGLQYEDGGIDSVAVGGSFYSLKRAIAKANAGVNDSTPVAVAEPPAPAATNFDGAEVEIDGL